jgi:ankyrin repeat protein
LDTPPTRKHDQAALVARLTRALQRGRLREAQLILRGSPDLTSLSPALACLCGDALALSSHRYARPSSLFETDPLTGLDALFAAVLSRVHSLSRRHAEGQRECLRLLLEAGGSPDAWRELEGEEGPRRESLLAAAIRGAGERALIELLLERGANVQEADALEAAVQQESPEAFELLLERGARPQGSQALCAALRREEPGRIARLLRLGADPSGEGEASENPLLVALAEERSREVFSLLLSAGADPRLRTPEGLSVYQVALRQGLIAQADLLVGLGADPHVERVDCLFSYCSRGMVDMALEVLSGNPELFDRAANPEERLLVDAVRLDKRRAVSAMLEVGFAVQSAPEGDQPLHVAARHGRSELIRPLIDAEAPLRARNRSDRTPLALAVRSCAEPPLGAGDPLQTVRALLEAGAWPEAWMLRSADDDLAELLNRYLAA